MSDWDTFRNDLGRRLPVLAELETTLYTAGARCVQFQQDQRALELSVVGNEFLPPAEALTEAEEAALRELGWQPPTPDLPHWRTELTWPVTTAQARAAAALITETIQLVLRPPSPDELATKTFISHLSIPRSQRR